MGLHLLLLSAYMIEKESNWKLVEYTLCPCRVWQIFKLYIELPLIQGDSGWVECTISKTKEFRIPQEYHSLHGGSLRYTRPITTYHHKYVIVFWAMGWAPSVP